MNIGSFLHSTSSRFFPAREMEERPESDGTYLRSEKGKSMTFASNCGWLCRAGERKLSMLHLRRRTPSFAVQKGSEACAQTLNELVLRLT